MNTQFLHIITDFGDAAVTGGLTIGYAAYYLYTKQLTRAAAIVAPFLTAAALIGIAKLALYSACTPSIPLIDLKSPSGHTALSVAAYFTIAWVMASELPGKWRYVPYVIATPLVFLIALSRVLLGAHTPADAVVGCAIGLIAAIWPHKFITPPASSRPPSPLFALIFPCLLLALHGVNLPAEQVIRLVSQYVRSTRISCAQGFPSALRQSRGASLAARGLPIPDTLRKAHQVQGQSRT